MISGLCTDAVAFLLNATVIRRIYCEFTFYNGFMFLYFIIHVFS